MGYIWRFSILEVLVSFCASFFCLSFRSAIEVIVLKLPVLQILDIYVLSKPYEISDISVEMHKHIRFPMVVH